MPQFSLDTSSAIDSDDIVSSIFAGNSSNPGINPEALSTQANYDVHPPNDFGALSVLASKFSTVTGPIDIPSVGPVLGVMFGFVGDNPEETPSALRRNGVGFFIPSKL